jgi:hypothetical protein
MTLLYEIIKKHTKRPESDYSDSWLRLAMEEYGRAKWDEACKAQKQECFNSWWDYSCTKERDEDGFRDSIKEAPKPEFKP